MTAEEVGLLILAGGRSERFGEADKLLADLRGMPLGLHIAHRMAVFPWKRRVAVSSSVLAQPLSDLGYTVVPSADCGGMGDNIALGVKSLSDVRAVLIVLADMPFVSVRHIQAILDAGVGALSIVASDGGGNLSPPVLFGRDYFRELARLSGEAGARRIILEKSSHVVRIEAGQKELWDIDTEADFRLAAAACPGDLTG